MLKLLKTTFHIIVIAMMLMLTLIWFWKNDAFDLRAVKIQGNCFVTKEEIFELAGIDFSKDIFEVDTDKIEDQILRHPMIEQVRVTRFLPSALKINVKERDLIAVISGSEISAVDVTENILSQFPVESVYDLPAITGFNFQEDSSGVRKLQNPELMRHAINILNDIKSFDLVLYYEISELHYRRNHGFVFYLKKSTIPVIFGIGDYHRKVVYFSTMYHYLIANDRLTKALAIDVRFKDQVVVKEVG